MTRQELLLSVSKTYKNGLELMKIKNKDYARDSDALSNFKSVEVIDLTSEQAILVRVLDKISRVSNLIGKSASVKDESVEDTLLDCINYLAILKAMLEAKN